MPYLLDLADAARKSGLKVVEVDGWKSRGHGPMKDVRSLVAHHTAGPKTGAYPSLGVVRDGRPGLEGPLGNLGLGRDCVVRVIAAGTAHHAGRVSSTKYSNPHALGIEAEATGVDEWPDDMLDAYARLCAALSLHYGFTVSRVRGHKEIAVPKGRKIDPNFSMPTFRKRVRGVKAQMNDVNRPLRQSLLVTEKTARKVGQHVLADRLKKRRVSLRPKKK